MSNIVTFPSTQGKKGSQAKQVKQHAVHGLINELKAIYEQLLIIDRQLDEFYSKHTEGYICVVPDDMKILEDCNLLLHTDVNGVLSLTSLHLGLNVPDEAALTDYYKMEVNKATMYLDQCKKSLDIIKFVQELEVDSAHYSELMTLYKNNDDQRVLYLEAQVKWYQIELAKAEYMLNLEKSMSEYTLRELINETQRLWSYIKG